VSKVIVARANSLAAFAIIALMALIGFLIWEGFSATTAASSRVRHSRDTLAAIKDLDLAVHDAETGQRGFLLTGDDLYLRPYNTSIERIDLLESNLKALLDGNSAQLDRLAGLAPEIDAKIEELRSTISLRRSAGFDAALQLVRTDNGRQLMQAITATIVDLEQAEQVSLDHGIAVAAREAAQLRWMSLGGAGIAMLLLLLSARWLARARLETAEAARLQRQQADQLRTSLDSLSQGIGVFDADRRLINWNASFRALLDLPSALAVIGTAYAELCAHTSADAAAPVLETEAQLRHETPTRSAQPVVYERTTAAGRVVEIRRTPLRGGGFVITVSDMTQRVRTEDALRDTQKMQAIGQLTGGIAHDFNNLLTIIIGNIESVARRVIDPALTVRLDRAMWGAQRGAKLTGHLLAFARKQPLDPRPIDLSATLPDMVGLLKRTLGEHIDVRVVESVGLWHALADPVQLESAVLNLALNARDAMPGGGRLTIEIANRVLDEDYARHHTEVTAGDYAMLAVSDTGTGMTAEVARRVFEPFFTTKEIGKGTGLGLAMVYGFIKQSKGHVNIYSEPGEGTSVKLYLPRAVAVAPQLRPPTPIEHTTGNARILLVEDDVEVRDITAGFLREIGHDVVEAGDGDSALRAFDAAGAAFDLLLVDVVLPGTMRGRQIAEWITQRQPSIQVLYMSGYTENSIVHHGRLDDGVQLLSKPFHRDQLLRKVADLLAPPPVMMSRAGD
jgi:signal transduction histidine kinase/CheY-like chemotaxis protein